MVIRPMGERAVLAEVESQDAVLSLHAALSASRPVGVVDLVPAARTVLVVFDPAALSAGAVRVWVEGAGARARPDVEGPLVEVPVRYDGPDLAETAALLGLAADELVARHRAAEWTVAFTGFAPGFGYLVSEDWPFDVPRLPSPRTRVPAGAVGVAAGFSGAYPRETPGGWRLIGTTDAVLFAPDSPHPVLLPPGARVRFVDVRNTARGADTPGDPADGAARHAGERSFGASGSSGAADAAAPGVRVIEPGLLATVQDLGRPGRASLGIARSGALDRAALRRANRLIGNPEDAAGLEITLGGFRAVAERDLWVALAGAFGSGEIDGRPLDRNLPLLWPAGAELRVGWFAAGARAWLAVRGGIDVPPVAGSRATDVLAGIGPAALAAGDVLPVGPPPADPVPAIDVAPWTAPGDDPLEIELATGPRAGWFAASALAALFEEDWLVGGDADRVGIRLDGPELERVRADELPSEGMVPGALQVPPSGRPVILLADGPVTGGYPVIAVVADASLDALAQAAPGTRLRFRRALRAG